MMTRDEALAREPDGNARTQGLDSAQRVLMTLRISRDSGQTWGQLTEVQENDSPVILDNPGRFPPCTCPRCTDRSPRSGASSRVES